MAKIMCWDLETSNLNSNFGYILCGGWKVYGKPKIEIASLADFRGYEERPTNDKALVAHLSSVLSTADLWVTWYGSRFDVPFLNSRLIHYRYKPLPPIPHVDGWRIAREKLKLHSNRLASVSAFLGLDEKTMIKGQHWVDASAGRMSSLRYVMNHCRQDVKVLEQAYERIRPLSSTHPNVHLTAADPTRPGCPICGTAGKLRKEGMSIRRTHRVQRYQCQKCGGWSIGKAEMVKGVIIR